MPGGIGRGAWRVERAPAVKPKAGIVGHALRSVRKAGVDVRRLAFVGVAPAVVVIVIEEQGVDVTGGLDERRDIGGEVCSSHDVRLLRVVQGDDLVVDRLQLQDDRDLIASGLDAVELEPSG